MPAVTSRDPTRTLALRIRFRQALSGRLRRVLAQIAARLLGRASRPLYGLQDDDEDERVVSWARALLVAALLPVERWWERFVRHAYRLARRQVRPRPVSAHAPVVIPSYQPTSTALRPLLAVVEARLRGMAEQASLAVQEALTRTRTQGAAQRAQAVREAFAPLIRRSELLSETTIVEAHATGTLDELEARGIERVTAEREAVKFTTRGDALVCSLCRRLEGRVYTTQAARGIIPVHPRCRCRWTPAVS
jgi:hypothetical protein